MQTVLLDTVAWDLVLDVGGNIAVASDPYSLAQDAASEMRTFQGEVYYDTSKGVPYWALILGKAPPLSLIKALLTAAAMLVPGVSGAICYISGYKNRKITGQVQILDNTGTTLATTGF